MRKRHSLRAVIAFSKGLTYRPGDRVNSGQRFCLGYLIQQLVPFPDEKSFIVSNIGGDNWRCLHGRFWIAKQEWYQARWGDQ